MRYNNDKPRDDVERGRNVRNALANASVSDGMAFLPSSPSVPVIPSPSNPSRNREGAPASLGRIHSPPPPLPPLSPSSRFDRSVPLESDGFRLASPRYPSGNYYKSESQSIFNPRGMVFTGEGKREGRGRRERESGDHRGGGGIDGWELMQQCQ